MIGKLLETPVTTVRVDWVCECGGKMVPTGQAYMSYPAQYPHRCDKCGAQDTARGETFPRIEHREPSAEGESIREALTRVVTDVAYQRRRVGSLPVGVEPEHDDWLEAMARVLDERLGRAAVKK